MHSTRTAHVITIALVALALGYLTQVGHAQAPKPAATDTPPAASAAAPVTLTLDATAPATYCVAKDCVSREDVTKLITTRGQVSQALQQLAANVRAQASTIDDQQRELGKLHMLDSKVRDGLLRDPQAVLADLKRTIETANPGTVLDVQTGKLTTKPAGK